MHQQWKLNLYFIKKSVIHKTKHFDENTNDKIVQSPESSFKINYFLYIVDQAITSLQSRFEQFQVYDNIFGFLFNIEKLKSLDDDTLKKYCLNLESILKHDSNSDIDGSDLFSKLKVSRHEF